MTSRAGVAGTFSFDNIVTGWTHGLQGALGGVSAQVGYSHGDDNNSGGGWGEIGVGTQGITGSTFYVF